MLPSEYFLFILTVGAAIFFSIRSGKLTRSGAATGGVIGCFIFLGAGFTGLAMIGLFFLLGVLATARGRSTKEKWNAAESDGGRRTAGQVVANGGIAGLLGLLALLFPEWGELFRLMMAASLSSATADTLSSELGTVYGRRFYNIITFRRDRRGENGVVSSEGTAFGLLGSLLIAAVHAAGYGWNNRLFLWIVLAGTAGNLADSILGATLERQGRLKNNAVNALNTGAAAVIAWVLAVVWG